MKQRYIFLDFDGVLHSLGDACNGNLFTCLGLLDAMLAKQLFIHQDMKVILVISSSWRLNYSISHLEHILSHDLYGNFNHIGKLIARGRISIDKTCPEIYTENTRKPDRFENNRYLEIKDYLDKHHVQFGDYVVIDDSDGLFFVNVLSKHDDKHYKVYLVSEHSDDSYIGNLDGVYSFHVNDVFEQRKRKCNCDWYSFTKQEFEFRQSYISTYKPQVHDGYLVPSDVAKIESCLFG